MAETADSKNEKQNFNKNKDESKGKVEKRVTFDVKDAPDSEDEDAGFEDGTDSDSEDESETQKSAAEKASEKRKRKNDPKLTAVGKALATKMLRSKKTKRDIYDDSWNR